MEVCDFYLKTRFKYPNTVKAQHRIVAIKKNSLICEAADDFYTKN